jgi:hypothetical protein
MQPATLTERLLRALAVVAVFILLGPPLGALAFFLTIGAINLGHGVLPEDLFTIGLFALIYGVPLSYMIGAAPAALAGLAVGSWQSCRGRVTFLGALLIGLLTGIGLAMFSETRVFPSASAEASELVIGGVLVATCLIPTVLCWLIVRRWGRGTA